MEKEILELEVENFTIDKDKLKIPFLYETWTWEGDESVLPYKWTNLIKTSNLKISNQINLQNENDFNNMKSYLKEHYYGKKNFDKQSFFFITYRSDVAACAYIDVNNNNTVDYFLVNQKHIGKNVEEGLLYLILNRAKKLKLKTIKVNTTLTNIPSFFFKEIGFK